MDRFKNVNDSLGQPVGDHPLQALTGRLQRRLRGEDTFGRRGGDECLVILDEDQSPDDAAGTADELMRLREEPCNFGTGYSPLAHPKRVPIDELKIDRSFVRDVLENRDGAEIAATLIATARQLRVRVAGDRVETAEQAAFLAAQGCPAYPGHPFRPPLPAGEFEALPRSLS